MIRGSEYMASIPVLRARVIETNIEDFLFSRSTKQRYPECSFSQFLAIPSISCKFKV